MLEARNLDVALPDRTAKPIFGGAPLRMILRNVSLSVGAGECVGVVGESGSGKSTLARTLLRLLEPQDGSIHFEGREITHLAEAELRPLRARFQIVFQDSQSALNPRRRIGAAIAEPLLAFGRAASFADALAQAGVVLERAGLPPEFASRYPHQLSGGQRQRVGIARAIAVQPALIVADEIVSGLDVSVQAQILDLLRRLRAETGLAVMLISHDLSVVRVLCDRVAVMRQGEIVETGPVDDVFRAPRHPYTRKLLRAIPLPEVDPGWIDSVDIEEEHA
jgi:peptide/nickel transport system ATP-binding protein